MSVVNSINGSSTTAVRVADLRAYLLGRGWKVKPFKRHQVIYFEGPPDDQGQPIVQLIPASENLRDFPLRVEEILATLSVIEDRPKDAILRSIISPTCDILRLRLESDETRSGTLEFSFLNRFFESMKNLLVFAACNQIKPEPFYRRAYKRASDFANHCRMRPAPIGSFVVDIESPIVPPANDFQITLEAFPYERLVLQSLMKSLGTIQSSIETGDTRSIFEKQNYVVNANICEALLGMKSPGFDVKLEASVSWSSVWPIGDNETPVKVAFEGKAFERIESIGNALRGDDKPQRRQLIGRVVRLSGEDPLRDDFGSLRVVMRPEGKNTLANVSIVLTSEQYRQACDAHKDGLKLSVTGLLMREDSRKWALLNLSDFKVLPA